MNTDAGDLPFKPVGGVGTLKIVTIIPANAFTINMNSTKGNKLIKADFF